MPIVYLTPQDISATDAEKVLDFLNRVATPEEIAEGIEISNELDIGLGVARSILKARESLGGMFTNLEQLLDVPLIGQERFTEIVAVLTGIALPQFSAQTLESLIQNEIARQFQQQPTLFAEGSTAEGSNGPTVPKENSKILQNQTTPYRIIVDQRPLHAFVGQPQQLLIRILDSETDKPVANQAVTFETQNAIVSTTFGYQVRKGEVVSSRSGVDGSIRLTVTSNTYERLTEEQRISLELALKELDAASPAPKGISDGLLKLVSQYRDNTRPDLRQAIDIYFRGIQSVVLDAVNRQDFMHEWQYRSSLLRIYLEQENETGNFFSTGVDGHSMNHGDGNISDVTAMQVGVYRVRWKEWLLPWYQVYLEWLKTESSLQADLLFLKGKNAEETGLASQLLSQAHLFVADQVGLVGEKLGQKVVGDTMDKFLATEAQDLSLETQKSLYPSLSLASSTIKTGGAGALALVNQTQLDIKKVSSDVTKVSSDVSKVSSDVGVLSSNVTKASSEISTLSTDIDKVSGDLVNVGSQLTSIRDNVKLKDGAVLIDPIVITPRIILP